MSCLQRDNYVPRNFPQSRRVQKPRERMGDRSGSGAGRPPSPQGARPGLGANPKQTLGSCSTDLKDQGKPCDQCRFDPTAQIHLKGIYNQGLSTPGGEKRRGEIIISGSHQSQGLELLSHRELVSYSLILQVQRIDQIAIREVEHYALDSDLR